MPIAVDPLVVTPEVIAKSVDRPKPSTRRSAIGAATATWRVWLRSSPPPILLSL